MVIAFGALPSNHSTTPWHPEPNGRGTWSLLSSCVITIALCAWTALHVNVPEHKAASRQWLRKTKWLVVGLAAPEMVVYVAWRQRMEAKRILEDVRKHLGQIAPRSKIGRMIDKCHGCGRLRDTTSPKVESVASSPISHRFSRPEWSLVHGFYAVMGGFALDSKDASETFLPDSQTRAALTPAGLRFLLEHEPNALPDISAEDINDKSKADGLKKFLVCIQALWFCASCITRLANRLPISLLELNAMAHAACALLIYAMWWQKPLDVDEPTLIGDDKVQSLLAYMWMSSMVSAKNYRSFDMHGKLRDEFDAMWMYVHPRFEDLLFQNDRAAMPRLSIPLDIPLDFRLHSDQYPLLPRHYASGMSNENRHRFIDWLHHKDWLNTLGFRFPAGLGVRTTAIDHLSPSTITRWNLAHKAIEKYGLKADLTSRHQLRSDVYDEDSRVKTRIPNTLSIIGSRPYEVWLGFAVAGLLYGGLHMLAWDAPFSSRAEQIIWRVAASSVTVTPLLLTPLAMLVDKSALSKGASEVMKGLNGKKVKHYNFRSAEYWGKFAFVIIIVPLVVVGPFLSFSYVLGRVYLVVECFKNVAYLPEAVFEDVSWPAYLPHIN
ncbi:hypothetical protein P7C71_g2896, partial [Lecanoromycetidae sp. Uapishka_2]